MSISPIPAPVVHDLSLAAAALVAPGGPQAADSTQQGVGAARAKPASDDYGDTTTTATSLTIASDGTASVNGKIETAGDLDFFRVTATGDGTMTVSASHRGGKNGVAATVTLFDSQGIRISPAGSTSPGKTASASVTSGRIYYIGIGAGSATGTYSVAVSLPQPTPTPTPDPTPTPTPTDPLTPPSFLPGETAYSAAAMLTETVISTTGNGDVLVVQGTDGVDSLIVSESGSTFTVTTLAGTWSVTGTLSGIVVYGFGGEDTIRLDHSIAAGLVVVVYAGAGNDTVSDAGPDKAYLYGQDGNDLLVSVGGGADVLYGGAGLDSFWFDSTDTAADVEATETAAKAVHKIAAFAQPTSTSNITLEVNGQALVQPTAGTAYTNLFAARPLFVDGPQYNDIIQGQVGDCYFFAGLSALADTDPGLLQQSIVALGDGSYAVRFYRSGTEVYYRIDAQLPTSGNSPLYAKLSPTGELWGALLEKAFAQFRSGQNSYSSINNGWMNEAYTAVTGGAYSRLSTTSYTSANLAQTMANSLAAGNAVTAGSYNPAAAPIVSSHAYNVRAVYQDSSSGKWYVTVYNPWGVDGTTYDSKPSDGLLTITIDQFIASFSTVEICRV